MFELLRGEHIFFKDFGYLLIEFTIKVHGDYDCMLNQTNIGENNNKFYVIQVLSRDSDGKYFAWNRWGRVVSLLINVYKRLL